MALANEATTGSVAPEDREEQAIIARWIEVNPHKHRLDEAWIVDAAVPVWSIVGYLAVVHGDIERTAAAYQIPGEAVEAARAYYRRHKALIDARIAANAFP